MAKKNFDTFLNTVKAPKISPEEIEEMTREVHLKPEKKPEPAPKPAQKTQKSPPKPEPKPTPGIRGRKPKMPELERMIRVSVDLPESTIIQLKTKVTREQTDMKNYIRHLVERELKKEFG